MQCCEIFMIRAREMIFEPIDFLNELAVKKGGHVDIIAAVKGRLENTRMHAAAPRTKGRYKT